MTTVSIKDAKNRFTELGRAAENGETITVTRNGKPAFVIAPLGKRGGLDLEAGHRYLTEQGIDGFFGDVPRDFDDPLPEDILLRPLPEK
ncbi:MAG: type II toxin-antitoxin system prevent-host-death family antitoxin [Rhizomicrobium sp.]